MIDSFSQIIESVSDVLNQGTPPEVTVQDFPDFLPEVLGTPCLLVDLVEFFETSSHSDGRYGLELELGVHCVLSAQIEQHERAVKAMALKTGLLVKEQRWGLGRDCQEPFNIRGEPSFGKKGISAWAVRFNQVFYFNKPLSEIHYIENVFVRDGKGETQYP